MFYEYLKERYNEDDFAPLTLEQVAECFEEMQTKSHGAQIFKTPRGFVTFRLEGDALIIFDMFVKPEERARADKESWKLWICLQQLAEKHNKRVFITFTEDAGKNKEAGLRVINYVGFKPAYKTHTGTTFIRGV